MSLDSIDKTLADRGHKYGAFSGHARITQGLYDFILFAGAKVNNHFSPSQKEALHMICHKIGRIVNGDPNYIDSWIDIAGYAKLVADELKENENFNSKIQSGAVNSGANSPNANTLGVVDPNHKAVPRRPYYHNDF
jgi:hypothetical protein